MDCVWDEPCVKHDCEMEQQKFFKEKASEKEKKSKCYEDQVSVVFYDSGADDLQELIEMHHKNVKELIECSKSKKEKQEDCFPRHFDEVKAIMKWKEGSEEAWEELKDDMDRAWGTDRDIIIKFTKRVSKRVAKLPNIDGVWGGKGCKQEHGKKSK